MPLYRDSERVSPTGNVTSRGVMNQLGRPQLGPLAVLVREAVQNSWDARADQENGKIIFGAAGWTLAEAQRDMLKRGVFGDLPPSESLPLSKHLHSTEPMQVIAIYDRGTTGLGGPTRADEPSRRGEARDFVDFLRNVGQPADKQLAGGTYGYGKAAFYRVSHTQTICVFTRCLYQGRHESRFIASALGNPYEDEKHVLHTGRHWWGERSGQIAEPLIKYAEPLADRLGIAKFLGQQDLGTVILILQPQLEEREEERGSIVRTAQQGMNVIAENLLLYFWPKMLRYGNKTAPITFEVSWEGSQIPLPNPEEFPPLQGFVEAMYHLKGYKTESSFPHKKRPISCERPQKLLGHLAVQKYPGSSENLFNTGNSNSAFANLNHHTALMRQPELVVKYLTGSASPNPQMGIYGVFITEKEVDAIFAESEPPTHDDWVSTTLNERWHRTFVNVTYRRIGEEFDIFAKPSDTRATGRQLTPLGAFANSLGSSLLASVPSNAATVPFSKEYQPPRLGELVNKPVSTLTPSASDVLPTGERSSEKATLFDHFRNLMRGENGEISNDNADLEKQNASNASPAPTPLPPPTFDPSRFKQADTKASNFSSSPSQKPSDPSGSGIPIPPKALVGRSKVSTVSRGEFVLVDNQPSLKVLFNIDHGKNAVGTQVSVDIRALIDGGNPETEPPVGGSHAEVLRWIDSEETIYAGSPNVFISAESGKEWAVVVSLPDDLMIDIGFMVQAVGVDE